MHSQTLTLAEHNIGRMLDLVRTVATATVARDAIDGVALEAIGSIRHIRGDGPPRIEVTLIGATSQALDDPEIPDVDAAAARIAEHIRAHLPDDFPLPLTAKLAW